MIASGDTGAYSRQNPLDFAAEFPAALPSCTAVGATILNENLTETSAVTCDFGWCSGGGLAPPSYFANTSAPWQAAAVSAYLQRPNLPPSKDWSQFVGGVGFPDVATIGTNHDIYYFGFRTEVAGTSASCPSMAGMVSLLNHVRLTRGKSSLGFLNQIIYRNPQLFNDIQQGTTPWPATVGWDATTGVGSPKFAPLLAYVLSLP